MTEIKFLLSKKIILVSNFWSESCESQIFTIKKINGNFSTNKNYYFIYTQNIIAV